MSGKASFVVFQSRNSRGAQYLFEHNGTRAWGPKALATTYRGRIDALRAAHLTGHSRGRRATVVRA